MHQPPAHEEGAWSMSIDVTQQEKGKGRGEMQKQVEGIEQKAQAA